VARLVPTGPNIKHYRKHKYFRVGVNAYKRCRHSADKVRHRFSYWRDPAFSIRIVIAVGEPYNWWSLMRKTGVNFETVRAWGRDFPDLEESAMYGSPALKLGKRLVACLAIHRSAEPNSLVVRTDFEQRAAILADDPETYYVTDHYVNHPVVLVRLALVQHEQLRDLLAAARHCVLVDAERLDRNRRLRGNRVRAHKGIRPIRNA